MFYHVCENSWVLCEMCCSKTDLTPGTLFFFLLGRKLIISENRKCREGLPGGQQKNTPSTAPKKILTIIIKFKKIK